MIDEAERKVLANLLEAVSDAIDQLPTESRWLAACTKWETGLEFATRSSHNQERQRRRGEKMKQDRRKRRGDRPSHLQPVAD